jgi:hypothetical protein
MTHKNKEERKRYEREYYLKNKEKIDKQHALRRKIRNKDRKQEYLKRRDIRLAAARKFRQEHPELAIQRDKAYRRSRMGYLKEMFRNISKRINRKGETKKDKSYRGKKLLFTRDEFMSFVLTSNFDDLHNQWIESGYQHKLAPSIDRVDI